MRQLMCPSLHTIILEGSFAPTKTAQESAIYGLFLLISLILTFLISQDIIKKPADRIIIKYKFVHN